MTLLSSADLEEPRVSKPGVFSSVRPENRIGCVTRRTGHSRGTGHREVVTGKAGPFVEMVGSTEGEVVVEVRIDEGVLYSAHTVSMENLRSLVYSQ